MTHAFYVLSVWVHVLAAAVWIGSMAFFAAILAPALRDPGTRGVLLPIVRIVGRRFRVLGWSCLAVLLGTGVSNLLLRGLSWEVLSSAGFWATDFGRALAWKTALVAAVIACTALHDAVATHSAATTERTFANRAGSWAGRATLLLSMAVVLLAVTLVRGSLW